MRKRITSALLTLVMLLSLVPAMGTTAAAASESHPTAVGELTKGKEACYYRIYPDGTGKTVTSLGYEKAPSDNVATNWNTFKDKIGTYYKGDTSKKIDGVAYYDPDSGVLYVKGCITDTCTAVVPSTDYSDVLTVIVDGDTIGNGGWHVEVEKKCLNKLNIEFRNNSTLTLQKRGNYTGSVLGVTGHNITGDMREQNRPVANAGDLTLSGSGTLKINLPHFEYVMYCIRAKNISVKDNVSLDIKTVGNTFIGAYGSEIVVRSAAIYCYEKLNIDTTGTVNIVAEKAKLKPNEDERGSFNAFSNIDAGRFNLVNAQSVTLNVVEKGDTFVNLYGTYQQDWYNDVKRIAEGKGWTVTETEDTAKPSYTVTMTRAGLSDAVLKVGSQEFKRNGAVTEGDLQADGSKQDLSIQVKVPAWLKTLDDSKRVGYNFTAAVYENGVEKFQKVNFNLAAPDVTLTLTGDFKPTAGNSYIVTFSIMPTVRATEEKLESAAINGNWLLTAVEKQKTFLSEVELAQGGQIFTGHTDPNVTVAADAPYQITDAGSWAETASGSGVYRRTVTLKVKDAASYGFMGGAKVTVTGGGDVTATNGSVKDAGDTMTTTLTAYRYYQVKFGDASARLIRAGTGVDAPAYTGTVEEGKEFKGWQAGEDGTIYAPGTTIFPDKDMTLTAVFEDQPVTPEPVYQFSLAVGEDCKPRVQFVKEEDYSSRGTNTALIVTVTDTSTHGAKLTGLTAKFSDTKFKGNNKWFELYTGKWDENFKEESALTHELSALTFDEASKTATFGVHLSRVQKTEGDPYSNKTMPVGHCYAIIELTATYEGGGEVKGNLIVELTVNERTEYRLNFTPKHESDNAYSFTNDTYVVLNGENVISTYSGNANRGDVVTIKAVPADGLEFVKWQEMNIAPTDAQVKFTDPNSAETSFIMPKYNVELTAVYKTSTHTHKYSDWAKLDDTYHYQTCSGTTGTCNEPTKVAEHSFGKWTDDTTDATRHYKECSVCHHKVYAAHEESAQIIAPAPTFDEPGAWHTDCEVCGKQMNTGDIDKLVKIEKAEITVTAPVRNAAPAWAETTDSTETAYGVADTEWDPEVSGTFAGGTPYTVKVYLEATGSNRFTDQTVFTINGQPATVVSGTEPTAAGTEYVILTYQFPATGTGSSSSGGSSSGGSTVDNPFTDVPSGSYYEDAVIWAADKGITGGTDATHFTPDGICTRAQAVTFLWRAAGSPAPKSTTMPFTDVKAGSYYEQAVLWAVENGITKGTTETTFSPSATCSRAQIVTFLWRSQKSPAAGETNPFTDVKSDAYYADAVLWAVKESVTKGTTDTTFAPNAGCTRAQIVTFIYRALAK